MFPTVFNPLLRRGGASDGKIRGHGVRALGYGHAGPIDLTTETELFLASFGPRATLVGGCTAAQVGEALGTDAVVLLSCHGTTMPHDGGRHSSSPWPTAERPPRRCSPTAFSPSS